VWFLLANSSPLLIFPLAIAPVVAIIQSDATISSSRPTFLFVVLWSDSETDDSEFRATAVLHEQFVAGLINAKLVINVTIGVARIVMPTPFLFVVHFNFTFISPLFRRAVGGRITWRNCGDA
jgi:hypothetical protein